MRYLYKYFLVTLIIGGGLSSIYSVSADTIGDRHTFFVNSTFDATGRSSIPATLQYSGAHAYFYAEDYYLNGLSSNGTSITFTVPTGRT